MERRNDRACDSLRCLSVMVTFDMLRKCLPAAVMRWCHWKFHREHPTDLGDDTYCWISWHSWKGVCVSWRWSISWSMNFNSRKAKMEIGETPAVLLLHWSPVLPPGGRIVCSFAISLLNNVDFKAKWHLFYIVSYIIRAAFCCLNKVQWLALNGSAPWYPSMAKWWLLHKRGRALSPSLTDWIVPPLWAAPLWYNDASPSQPLMTVRPSAINSPTVKKSSAVDQRGCQTYVWPRFCQAQTGNIWTEMLSVMWQSFTTGCTLSAQDSSGPGIRSRWRTPKYFTVDPSFEFFSHCGLEPVQSTKKPFPSTSWASHTDLWKHHTTICGGKLKRRDLLLTDTQNCVWLLPAILTFSHLSTQVLVIWSQVGSFQHHSRSLKPTLAPAVECIF